MGHDIAEEFDAEFEVERLVQFRRRYLVLVGVMVGIALGLGLLQLHYSDSPAMQALKRTERLQSTVAAFAGALGLSVRLGVSFAKREGFTRELLLKRVKRLIMAFTLVQIIAARGLMALLNAALYGPDSFHHLGMGVPPLLGTLLVHFLAALIIPWTPREAVRPIVPFVGVYVIIAFAAVIVGDSDWSSTVIMMVLIPAVVLPGIGISWLRHSAFRHRFMNKAVRERYAELSSELSTARRIHDRLFPLPVREGPVRVEFAYEPMRQIGGDILYARPRAGGGVDVVVIDVTGHGIAAALAVNRLHAELNRVYGQDPGVSPGGVITALNSYMCLTMAADRFFATALCMRVDPAARIVTWANAGHPPVFRWRRGTCTLLESTVVMLGVVDGEHFDAGEQQVDLEEGDVLFVYSDGAMEARVAGAGAMLAVAGLRGMARPEVMPERLLGAVKEFRKGPPQDDTLVVRVERVRDVQPARTTENAGAGAAR